MEQLECGAQLTLTLQTSAAAAAFGYSLECLTGLKKIQPSLIDRKSVV